MCSQTYFVAVRRPGAVFVNRRAHGTFLRTIREATGEALETRVLKTQKGCYTPDLARIFWSSFKVINKLNTGEPNHAFETI